GVALDAEDGLRVEAEQSTVEQIESRPVERPRHSLIDNEDRLGVAELGKTSGSARSRGLTNQEHMLFRLLFGFRLVFFLGILFIRAALRSAAKLGQRHP